MNYWIPIFALTTLMACSEMDKNDQTANELTPKIEMDTSPKQPLDNKVTSFLWREMVYDSLINDTVSTIFINQKILPVMTDAEKAAVGYIATFIGSECDWDGATNNDRSNLNCKVISALGLGYQCSEQHLGFLQKWFAADKDILAELENNNCPTTPYTATNQTTFEEVSFTTKNDTIIVAFKASGLNMREQSSWEWSEIDYFRQSNNTIELINKEKSAVVYQ